MIVLAVLFSALFLGLFVAIALGLAVRGWLLGRGKPARPDVIEAEYTVIDQRDSPGRRGPALGPAAPASYPKADRAACPENDWLARVVAMAERIWHDEAEVRRFLNTPHPELNGRTPVEAAKTEDGARTGRARDPARPARPPGLIGPRPTSQYRICSGLTTG